MIGLILVCMFVSLVYATVPVIEFASEFNNSNISIGESRVFYVLVSDADGDNLSYTWRVDGVEKGNSNTYTYVGSGSGIKVINVEVSDGVLNVSRGWNVYVSEENYEEFEPVGGEFIHDWFWVVLIIIFVVVILIVVLFLIIELRKGHAKKISEKRKLSFSTQ